MHFQAVKSQYNWYNNQSFTKKTIERPMHITQMLNVGSCLVSKFMAFLEFPRVRSIYFCFLWVGCHFLPSMRKQLNPWKHWTFEIGYSLTVPAYCQILRWNFVFRIGSRSWYKSLANVSLLRWSSIQQKLSLMNHQMSSQTNEIPERNHSMNRIHFKKMKVLVLSTDNIHSMTKTL